MHGLNLAVLVPYLLGWTMVLPEARGIQWLALGSSKLQWNQSSSCGQARKQHILQGRQVKLCKKHLEVMPQLEMSTQKTIAVCQEVFSDRRWNCSSLNEVPTLSPDLTDGTREQAFVYALSSAAIAHVTARSCSAGSLLSCGCGQVPHEPPHGDFKWGGCADNIHFGVKFSRSFADAPWKKKNLRKNTEAVMNRHNNKAGRRILKDSLLTQCKCHGVSGSCNIKTCWRALPRLLDIGHRLKRKYHVATEVLVSTVNTRKFLKPANSQVRSDLKDHLIFAAKSPDYCLYDPKVGSVGTYGRQCNTTSQATDGCDSMCCGRGYRTYTVQKFDRCHCKYYWCCYVKCKTCRSWVDVHECN